MIVALGHLSRTGKDTVASMLDLHASPAGSNRTGFFWEAKKVAHQIFGWAGVKDRLYYDANPGMRNAIIPALGVTVLDIWIKLGIKLVETHPLALIGPVIARDREAGSSRFTIVSDLRRELEIDEVRRAGGVAVKVHRPGVSDLSKTDKELLNYPRWDYVIVNDGTIDVLYAKVLRLGAVLRKTQTVSTYICPVCHHRETSPLGALLRQCDRCHASWEPKYNLEIC